MTRRHPTPSRGTLLARYSFPLPQSLSVRGPVVNFARWTFLVVAKTEVVIFHLPSYPILSLSPVMPDGTIALSLQPLAIQGEEGFKFCSVAEP